MQPSTPVLLVTNCADVPPTMRVPALGQTSAGGCDKYTLDMDTDDMMAVFLPLCVLLKDAASASSCDSFITACLWTDDGSPPVCGRLLLGLLCVLAHMTAVWCRDGSAENTLGLVILHCVI